MKEFDSLNEAIKALYGSEEEIKERRTVSGGDINRAYILRLSDGSELFMKENSRKNLDFFRAEVLGLAALKETGTLKIPEVKALGTDGDSAFLLMEAVNSGIRKRGFFEEFGIELAAMHMADTDSFVPGGRYGFYEDNYIGSGFQKNTAKDKWIDFFRECRLEPQLERASRYFDETDRKRQLRFLDRLDSFLYEPERPALLHGDLWGGNYMCGSDGEPVLIDPAVYVGCNEADIAMTELFGGYDRAFYSSYWKSYKYAVPGYEDRRDIYNLYHLLNHLNLFGASYLSSVRGIIGRYEKE
ncbi:MAG: fructosamine kinase family protein [Lachnospiraceae bacterium]|nr:fructosamine kinase family protein [Lachnospiraceae bacterium]